MLELRKYYSHGPILRNLPEIKLQINRMTKELLTYMLLVRSRYNTYTQMRIKRKYVMATGFDIVDIA